MKTAAQSSRDWYWRNRESRREYYQENRERICAQAKQWKLDNPERYKELRALSRRRLAHKTKLYNAAYHRAHKEQRNQEALEWRKNNRARVRAADGLRKRYRRTATVGDLTEIAKVYERREWWRQWFDVVVDHTIPLAKGGTHETTNLQIIYRSENAKKKDSLDYKPRVIFL